MKQDKQKRKEQVVPTVKRQIDVLKRLYDVDEENKIVHVTFHYEKVSEILSTDLSNDQHPHFDPSLITRIEDITRTFPMDYMIDVKFQINDYEGYDPEQISTSFKDVTELHHYRAKTTHKKTWLKGVIFAIVGVMILILYNIIEFYSGFSPDIEGKVVKYLIDAFACVTIWQSVTVIALAPPELIEVNKRFLNTFAGFHLLDKEGKVIYSISRNDLKQEWVEETKKNRVGRIFLLVSGAIFLCKGIMEVVSFFIEDVPGYPQVEAMNRVVVAILYLVEILLYIFEILAAIGAISRYREKGPFRKLVGLFAVLAVITETSGIIFYWVLLGSQSLFSGEVIVSFIISVLSCALYFLGYFLSKPSKKEK